MEQWRTIKGFDGYEVSNLGNVRRGSLVRKQDIKNGYKQVRLSRHNKIYNKRPHRLVWENFVGDIPEGYHINHKNRDRLDNRLENLEPLSPSDNNLHYKMNVTYRGNIVNTSKFTEEQVREIRRRRAQGEGRRALAKEFGVNESSIYRIVKGQNWSHIN